MKILQNFKTHTVAFIGFAFLLELASIQNTNAAGYIQASGTPIQKTDPYLTLPCEEDSPNCQKALWRILSGASVGPTTLFGGQDPDSKEWTGGIEVSGMSAPLPIGSIEGATFQFINPPEGRKLRFRFQLLKTESLFFCQDQKGERYLPFLGAMFHRCLPTASLGMDLSFMNFTWDQWSSRSINEWFNIGFSWHPLSNGHGLDVTQKNLAFFISSDFRSLDHETELNHLGAKAGVRALFRSESRKWEAKGSAYMRTPISKGSQNFSKKSIVSELRLSRNFALNYLTAIQLGIEAELAYSDTPKTSIGKFVSDVDQRSEMVGVFATFRRMREL